VIKKLNWFTPTDKLEDDTWASESEESFEFREPSSTLHFTKVWGTNSWTEPLNNNGSCGFKRVDDEVLELELVRVTATFGELGAVTVKYTDVLLQRVRFFASFTLKLTSYIVPIGLLEEGATVTLKSLEDKTLTTQEEFDESEGDEDFTQLHSHNKPTPVEVEETSGSKLPKPSRDKVSPWRTIWDDPPEMRLTRADRGTMIVTTDEEVVVTFEFTLIVAVTFTTYLEEGCKE
jgi:hypothetical protein